MKAVYLSKMSFCGIPNVRMNFSKTFNVSMAVVLATGYTWRNREKESTTTKQCLFPFHVGVIGLL